MRKNNNKEYLENLLKNIIGECHFNYAVMRNMKPDVLLEHTRISIEFGFVKDLKAETLGKIMCSFKEEDVMMTKKEIFDAVHFSGDTEEFLREVVAVFLAHSILERVYYAPMREE